MKNKHLPYIQHLKTQNKEKSHIIGVDAFYMLDDNYHDVILKTHI